MPDVLRIANCSGFYGDRFSAAREMVEGGPIDFLTGEYLAELTMLILFRSRAKDPEAGYATTFLRQMEEVLGTCAERGIKVVANAGGLNPSGLARRMRELIERLGLKLQVAHIEGDDLMPRMREIDARLRGAQRGESVTAAGISPVSANVYLGAWGIVEALKAGADIVIAPRITDASLAVGPAAWRFGWALDDWDCLAGAVVAGHVIECGAQATGGNYSFFREIPGLVHPGFPIAEVFADGSSVITKHPGTTGVVTVGTVTAQLLYEIDGPRYLGPDVITRFDTIRLAAEGPDRVRISGVRGEPAPQDLKVSVNYLGGYRNSMTFALTGLDIEAKADLARETVFVELGGEAVFDDVDVQLVRTDRPDSDSNEGATAYLRIQVKDHEAKKVGRAFSNRFIEMATATYPGFYTTTPPSAESPFGVYWPGLIDASEVHPEVVLSDGRRLQVPEPPRQAIQADEPEPAIPGAMLAIGPTVCAPLGTAVGARSGDKGGNANVGLWARSDAAFDWLDAFLTTERFKQLLPEARDLEVRRYRLPNLRSLNFVVVGLLGQGVASSTRHDAQAKSLGEYLRSRSVALPEDLQEGA